MSIIKAAVIKLVGFEGESGSIYSEQVTETTTCLSSTKRQSVRVAVVMRRRWCLTPVQKNE